MAMTVNQLHKLTAKLIEQGHGFRWVCVEKPSFSHPLEESDGVNVLNVEAGVIEHLELADGDGGTAVNKDGAARTMTCFVLLGDVRVTSSGKILTVDEAYGE